MKDFFEITDMARADMAREEVPKAIEYELMRQGVPRAVPVTLEEEVVVNLSVVTMYVVNLSAKIGYNNDTPDIAFETQAEALAAGEAMVKGARMTNTSWNDGTTYKIIGDLATFSVSAVDFAMKHDVDSVSSILKENGLIRARNNDAEKAYKEAAEAAKNVADPVWEKYNDSLNMLSRVNAMRKTHTDYTELAGDEETAMKFFKNAHEHDDLIMYEEWTGIDCSPATEMEGADD